MAWLTDPLTNAPITPNLQVLSLPRGITAVKIEGNLRVLQQGRILASRSFPVSTFLNASGRFGWCDVGHPVVIWTIDV